ncbi:hypothetical protein CHL76_14255 [Marinococcus halophilus]|uniref:Levanase n=1 Tax=Marinococcus halophilus TaxID=1371 RepID=A0A510Y956_MARHA|nr:hypothetical protein CHL76_14255 [Marinococcus halophilus]GEK59900.1 hypothetical protein MHA01_28050 [Marinococcus halophilus]
MYYQEPFRQQLHYSPRENWMNDPNGLVYFEGEYHLFYQYNPYGNDHAHMHWGHAVSQDLTHWKELPVALEPDELGTIFSGGAVVDKGNSSGLFQQEAGGMVAIYTQDGATQQQSIAYSEDHGRTWTKYKHNPVIENQTIKDFRDPKVFWHEETQKWIMSLACGDHIQFYRSPNLIDWTYQSSFGQEYGSHAGVWECPDLFSLTVESTATQQWVLIVSINDGGPNGGSAVQYFTGDFDGVQFHANETPTEAIKWADEGTDFYAAVSWENTASRYWIGWMNNWQYAGKVPVSPWRSSMSIVRRLSLQQVNDTYVLKQTPTLPDDLWDEQTQTDKSQRLVPTNDIAAFDISPLSDIQLTVGEKNSSTGWGIYFISDLEERFTVEFDESKHTYTVHRTEGMTDFSPHFPGEHTGSLHRWKVEKVHCLLDHASIELFINDGLSVSTTLLFPKGSLSRLEVFCKDQPLVLDNVNITDRVSIWNDQHTPVN